jgi:hypothetical protein
MNEETGAVDILAIASASLSEARRALDCARMLQAGPAAELRYQLALVEVGLAERGMAAARDLAISMEARSRPG